jgi:hypothetical protein
MSLLELLGVAAIGLFVLGLILGEDGQERPAQSWRDEARIEPCPEWVLIGDPS